LPRDVTRAAARSSETPEREKLGRLFVSASRNERLDKFFSRSFVKTHTRAIVFLRDVCFSDPRDFQYK